MSLYQSAYWELLVFLLFIRSTSYIGLVWPALNRRISTRLPREHDEFSLHEPHIAPALISCSHRGCQGRFKVSERPQEPAMALTRSAIKRAKQHGGPASNMAADHQQHHHQAAIKQVRLWCRLCKWRQWRRLLH